MGRARSGAAKRAGYALATLAARGQGHSPISRCVRHAMCKAADRGMTITDVKLLEKHGGKSGSYVAP